jgi:hypothetical protein
LADHFGGAALLFCYLFGRALRFMLADRLADISKAVVPQVEQTICIELFAPALTANTSFALAAGPADVIVAIPVLRHPGHMRLTTTLGKLVICDYREPGDISKLVAICTQRHVKQIRQAQR